MLYDLDCRFDSRKSFYGKARVKEEQYNNFKALILYSYGTEVASIEYHKNNMIMFYYNGKYSQTTTRHQKEFFKQNGLSDFEIKELFSKGTLRIEK
jgi:hypothetical protein